jgi:hypothetical protein
MGRCTAWTADEMVARHAVMTMEGLNADNATRILGVSRPTMFPLMAGSRPRRTGPHQLAYAANRRESKHLAGGVGSGPSSLTSIPDCIVDDITGYLESFRDWATKERTDRKRRAGALEMA